MEYHLTAKTGDHIKIKLVSDINNNEYSIYSFDVTRENVIGEEDIDTFLEETTGE